MVSAYPLFPAKALRDAHIYNGIALYASPPIFASGMTVGMETASMRSG
jgi:hypothetical protein